MLIFVNINQLCNNYLESKQYTPGILLRVLNYNVGKTSVNPRFILTVRTKSKSFLTDAISFVNYILLV